MGENEKKMYSVETLAVPFRIFSCLVIIIDLMEINLLDI